MFVYRNDFNRHWVAIAAQIEQERNEESAKSPRSSHSNTSATSLTSCGELSDSSSATTVSISEESGIEQIIEVADSGLDSNFQVEEISRQGLLCANKLIVGEDGYDPPGFQKQISKELAIDLIPSSFALLTSDLPSTVIIPEVSTQGQIALTPWLADSHSNCSLTSQVSIPSEAGHDWSHRSLRQETRLPIASCLPNGPLSRTTRDLQKSESFCQREPLVKNPPLVTESTPQRRVSLQRVPKALPGSNPRRTSATNCWTKPKLVRQHDRRDDFVTHLVDSSTQLVAHIWPTSSTTNCHLQQSGNQVITLRFFIQETLRRSRSTYSTLQLTLYYLHLVKLKTDSSQALFPRQDLPRAMRCGRRMFLAGLILASKYLQDRNYSTKAWSKITSLPIQDINANERVFLQAIDYSLHLNIGRYNEWCGKVSQCVGEAKSGKPCPWGEVLSTFDAVSAPHGSTQLSGFPFGKTSYITDSRAVLSDERSSTSPQATTNIHPLSTNSGRKPSTSAPSFCSRPHTSSPAMASALPAAMPASHTHEFRMFANGNCLPTLGCIKAPQPAAVAAGLATSQLVKETVASYANGAGLIASPASLACSEDLAANLIGRSVAANPTLTTRRPGLPGRSRYATPPNPIKAPPGLQLPTPPMSVRTVATSSLDTPMTINSESDSDYDSRLCHRLSFRASKHGLESKIADTTLPPLKQPSLCESFNSSRGEAFSSPLSMQDSEINSLSCVQVTALPAIAHLLHCGLERHLEPVVKHGLQTSIPEASAHGFKRSREDDVDARPISKVLRSWTSC